MEEDEQIADWLVAEKEFTSVALQPGDDTGIIETNSPVHNACGYRFYPDKIKGEGFYIAVFKKKASIAEENNRGSGMDAKIKSKSERLTAAEKQSLLPYIERLDDFFYIRQNGEAVAIPIHLERDLAIIQSALYIKKAGVKLGTLIRNELIPDHELALSTILSPAISSLETDKETALQYLRKQDIKPAAINKGWALVTYKKLALGWIKVLPNRINNYYPKDWRILNK